MEPAFGDFIRDTRAAVENARPTFTGSDLKGFAIRPPFLTRLILWLIRDEMSKVLGETSLLAKEGEVVWGHLVQANKILFDRHNRETAPANVVYSTDPFYDSNPDQLGLLAEDLFRDKGGVPDDEELAEFVDLISRETRMMQVRLPSSFTYGRDVYLTTCFIQPSHLPRGFLAAALLPLLVCPARTKSVMVLPSRFWSDGLRALWGA